MKEIDLSLMFAMSLLELNEQGYGLHVEQDFDRIIAMTAAFGRTQQPMMEPARLDFTRAQAFWLFLMHNNTPVGGCAAKYEDLQEEPFSEYLIRTSASHYGGSPIESISRPVSQEISGRLVYLGELQLVKELQGRSGRLLPQLVKALQALSALKWPDFDWMYAFIPKEHQKLARAYGFTWQMPNAISWKEPTPPGRRSDHSMMAVRRSHLHHIASGAHL